MPEPARLPLFLDLTGRRAVVVGGGPVALRRTRSLAGAGARVTVIAPEVLPELADVAGEVLRRRYAPGDLAGAWLVHAVTDDPAVNATVAADADAQRTWCVRADAAEESTAWAPAVTRSGAVTLAVSAGGDPRRAARLSAAFAAALDAPALDAATLDAATLDAGTLDARTRDAGTLDARTPDTGIRDTGTLPLRPGRPAGTGRVALVGGGPGDPGLITVRGRRLLAEADVVVVDRLAPRELLAALDPDVEIVEAGKAPGCHDLSQQLINDVLIDRAQAGKRVVRLKGGDPFVFGRGGEEALACAVAGVPFEVVPGVTSAIAAPAYAGIPVTQRGVAQDVAVVSAHGEPGDPASTVDWDALAAARGTVVLLMAMGRLERIAKELIARGRSPDTPAAVIAAATLPDELVVIGTLEDIAQRAAEAGAGNPAVVVVGDVVRLREQLAWR